MLRDSLDPGGDIAIIIRVMNQAVLRKVHTFVFFFFFFRKKVQ